MSISVQQLKRILGSFSQIVAKDVSGIKTTYATKKDVEGFAKVSDLNNVYIKKGDIHTEDYVTNVIFRDAYQNRLVKKTDLPALDTIATKQEISNAIAAIQVPSIEGLAKESEVETKLADYAKTAEVAEIYATKEAVNSINGLDADTIATLKNLSQHSDLTAIANKVDNVYTKAETDDKLAAKADVTAIPDISNLATKEEVSAVDNKLATKADASAIPSIEGLAKTTEVETKLADYAKKTELPSIEGLAKTSEVEATYAKKSELPSVEDLATKAEVATIDAKFATKADVSAIPSIEGLAKTTEVVAKSVYDEKVQSLESEISALKAKLATVASGATEQRPTENLVVGQQYFDTTLGVPVFWNGTEWHNPFAKITTVEVEPH